MNTNLKISIVTVAYNAENSIENTILSVLDQTYKNIEYIIIDGGSIDNTINIVKKYEHNNLNYISEKDNGIYNAMNKSINMVTGDYVYFLNCGDTFHSNHTVKEVVEFLSRNKTEILFGNIQNVYTDHKQIEYYNNLKIRSSSFLKGQSICHQAIFADRKIFEDIQFDEQYKICADKNWIIECMVNNKNFMHANILICDFDKHGISANPQNSYVIKSETNKMLKGRFPIKFYLFKSIRFVPMFFRR